MSDDALKARLAAALKYYQSVYMFEAYEITSPTSRGMDEDTPLHMAAFDGRSDLIADMLPFVEDINIPGDIGNSPLHYAVMKNHLSTVELLLEQGADVMRKNDYDDPSLEWMKLNPAFHFIVSRYSNE